MIWFPLFLLCRLAVIALALLSWAYAMTTYSAFAFEMFVRPRLIPWLPDFVAWHHLWTLAAYALSVVSLGPELLHLRSAAGRRHVAPWLALGYSVTAGVIATALTQAPYLPDLPSQAVDMGAVVVPLAPLVWLALIDWTAAVPAARNAPVLRPAIGLTRLLVSALIAAALIWVPHFARVAAGHAAPTTGVAWLFAAAWTLTLAVNGFMVLFAVTATVTTLGSRWRRDGVAVAILGTTALAIALTEFCRRLVFGSLTFDRADPAWLAGIVGATLALVWSGLMLRFEAARRPRSGVGLDSLLITWRGGAGGALLALVAVQAATLWLLPRLEHLDWDFVAQRTIAGLECALVFGLALRLTARFDATRWSMRRYAAVPVAGLLSMYVLPWAIGGLPGDDSAHHLPPDALLDELATADPVFGLMTRGLVQQPRPDAAYFSAVLRSSARSLETPTAVPDVRFAVPLKAAPSRPPHVFVFVIDSLRRDYLAPMNADAGFTPSIAAWARDSFVFDNAFTRYGGTWLAIPSIWSGAELPRSWGRMPFAKVNAIEKLTAANGYHVVLNDYTVTPSLGADSGRTFLDPELRSIGSDLCSQVDGLRRILETPDGRPVFAFLAPMNVHTLSATPAPLDPAQRPGYRGFNEVYAARLQRADACFGRFMTYLTSAGLADDSIVVLTSDHGDSLGEGGQWGHGYSLAPEVVRIPLIVGLPARLRTAVTTDLSQIAFSTDLAPTLYGLLGYPVRDLGPHFGAPLFTPADRDPPSRRRESYLLMSSYGASYGMVRRNGRLLYVSDLVAAREYAYDLRGTPLGRRVPLVAGLRNLNQALIREQIRGVEGLYHPDAVDGPAAESATPKPSLAAQ